MSLPQENDLAARIGGIVNAVRARHLDRIAAGYAVTAWVVVQAASEERAEALDGHLWTFRDDSFLPHGTWREAEARQQPILLLILSEQSLHAFTRASMFRRHRDRRVLP